MIYLVLVAFVAGVYPSEGQPFEPENPASFAQSQRQPPEEKEGKPRDNEPLVLQADQVKEIEALKGKEIIVEGKVHEIFTPSGGSLTLLNLGKDYRTCFKVVIRKKDFEKFGGLDKIKSTFDGKKIRVEGKISIYRELPQIEVGAKSQIRVVK